ncbi:hypothetical protein M153_2990008639 [Pseudoloma neurophilia]|uniref:Leucine rich repeat protein n=1 Tax=Pseudoloma neurophilia TaxID=146866 RepID=A0A0R0M480_9MICR|nr:hypothetical protein M153_2990008639 [Pseudoloma neurophilia]
MGIKGPRSALSQFLEEENIKVVNKEKTQATSPSQPLVVRKGPKRLKFSHPTEIVNIVDKTSLKDKILDKIHETPCQYNFTDDQLLEYSLYLYKKIDLTQEIFDHLASCAKERLYVYDCSNILNFDGIKGLKYLHLGYCGQMRNKHMDLLLKNNPDLVSLNLEGAFLLENLNLSKHCNLRDLSVRECSRLTNSFIDHLNTHSKLDLLDISHCFAITKKAQLKIDIKCLKLDRVAVTTRFFKQIDILKIEELSISNCPFLFKNGKNKLKLKKFRSLKKLNIEGISEISKVKIKNLEKLHAHNCFNIHLSSKYKNLTHLDVSNINLSQSQLNKILKYKKLEYLNLSFSQIVDDQFVLDVLKNSPKIKTIVVFGCFQLTEKLGELAWQIKDSIKIIGNHAETKFLLQN